MKHLFVTAFLLAMPLGIIGVAGAGDDVLMYAVIREIPKDKTHVPAKVSLNDVVSDTTLLVPESIATNPVWRTLEICHAVRLEGIKSADGIKVVDAKIINASMLPMSLQAFAGDCLMKKALSVAPLMD